MRTPGGTASAVVQTEPATPTDDPDTPGDRILRWVLLLLTIPGFASPATSSGPPIRVGGFILATILIIGIASAGRSTKPRATLLLVAGGYLALKATATVLGPHPASPADFVAGYKAYVFLIVIVWFVGSNAFTTRGLAQTTRWLLAIFAIKYAVSIAAGNPRPVVWIENNFELMTLIGFAYLSFRHLGPRRNLWMAVLVGVVFASGSRSGLMELSLCMLLLYWRPRSRLFLLSASTMAIVGWWAFRLIEQRTVGGITGTDRWRFFTLFEFETRSWSATEWLVGAYPVTPLSSTTCGELARWRSLFSGTGDGQECYSVILHSFALRAVFDQGILGTLLLLTVLWLALKTSGVRPRDRVALLGIGVLNATSVSAFNSEYLMLVTVVAAGLVQRSGSVAEEAAAGDGPGAGTVVAVGPRRGQGEYAGSGRVRRREVGQSEA